MITVVITSCGRMELLKRTVNSFFNYVDVFPSELVLIDDSGDKKVHQDIADYFQKKNLPIPVNLVFNETNIGQINSIDIAYSRVKTPLIFHLENDWEFIRSGFMADSLYILESLPKIITVWLRGTEDTNTHPVEPALFQLNNIDYRYMAVGALGGNWHGFTWNPGLRRLKDYKLIAPFSAYLHPGDFAALTECRIGQRYYQEGFRAVTLLPQYCKHIG